MNMGHKLKKIKKTTWLIILITGVTILCFYITLQLWWCNPFQLYQDAFARYGTFIGGSLGVILSAANICLLLYIWYKQSQQADIQNFEGRFFELLKIRIQLRDGIKYNEKPRKPEQNVHLGKIPECYGNDAINAISNEISLTNNVNPDSKDEMRRDIYLQHSRYLRHFFDFSLSLYEYIDQCTIISEEQRREYVDIVINSASYDESLLWILVQTDYDTTVREGLTQLERYDLLNKKYKLGRRLVKKTISE